MVEGRTHKPVIRVEECRTCGVCVRGCPAQVIPEYRAEETSLRGALYRDRFKGLPTKGKSPPPPCQEACPIHQDTRGYVSLISKGKMKEALELIRDVNPLPAICGFICHHPCEEACLRGAVDQAVPIRSLKRFVAEYGSAAGQDVLRKPLRQRTEKILVVGSGPSGLTAAHDLAILGYKVILVEALPVLGGMLAVGIPEFRLPRDILNSDIEKIRQLGVEMRTDHAFEFNGAEGSLKKLGYGAIFVSIGAHRSERLKIPGEKLKGVFPGLEFLRNVNLGKQIKIGRKTAVIGGGNVALDVARSAIRLGAESVDVYYRRSRKEMSAIPEELEEAIREGITIHFLSAPVKILGPRGKATGMECVEMRLGEPDATGRRKPIPVEGSKFKVRADSIVAAVGQKVDPKMLKGFERNPDGTLRVDPETGATSVKGVYSGGDVVTGSGWAVNAIAAGKRAAAAIHRYVSG
jgi:heterodisulfide reductase subunit A2